MEQKIRSLQNKLVEYYEFEITQIKPLSKKGFYIKTNLDTEFFLKQSPINTDDKFHFLMSQGIDNVLYPEQNGLKKYVTKHDYDSFYITKYYQVPRIIEDIKAENMLNALNHVHQQSIIKRQLSTRLARPKFEEITKQLDYKFKLIESYIRTIERSDIDPFSMPVLANYQHILDAKKEMVRLQKRIISSIKAREKVNYVYVHNRPTLDHIINVKGINYLTSIENGKIGINSLDIAKFYVENEFLNLDFHQLIVIEYFNGENSFYYDYFRFLVLFIYIKKLVIVNEKYVTTQSMITVTKGIKRYFTDFLDNKEDVSEQDESEDQK